MTTRLCRRLEEGEFETRRASGEGLPGGPPTAILSSCSLAALEERDDRRSAGNGMGPRDDMVERVERVEVGVSRRGSRRGGFYSGTRRAPEANMANGGRSDMDMAPR